MTDETPKAEQNQYQLVVNELVSHGDGNDGEFAAIMVKDRQDRNCAILIPHEAMGAMMARMTSAAERAAQSRKEAGKDEGNESYSLPLEGMGIGVRSDGNLALRLKLRGSMNIDVPVPADRIDTLRESLDKAEKMIGEMKAKKN